MKTTTIRAWLAAAGLMAALPATAANYTYGDLLVGFDGSGNNFIYDLGQFSSLSIGETWNVGANLGTRFGVVGGTVGGTHIYATSSDYNELSYDPTGNGSTAISNIKTLSGQPNAITLGGSRTPTAGDTTGWTYQTDQAAGAPGNTFFNNYFNPNVSAGATAFFFDNLNSGAVGQAGAFVYDGVGGVLTFVPEPGSSALFILGGMVALVSRFRARRV
jgi:hypothetical protein